MSTSALSSMPQSPEPQAFSAPAQVHTFNGILFDMDGTIIDSTDAIIKHWHRIGAELGVDPNVILATSHGRRSIDVLKDYDPARANWEYIRNMEAEIPVLYGPSAVSIPGSRALLATVSASCCPWAIVTSGTRPLVEGWLHVMNLAHPEVLVTAEDVEHGKPDPGCYLLGRQRLGLKGLKGSKMLVVEDAPAGVRAGKAAGFEVLGLATTHAVEEVRAAGADWVVRDLRSLRFLGYDEGNGEVRIDIVDALLT